MKDVSLKELLEAGCHFGHQVTRQNPKAREFIFQAREGINIIDLAKTREGLLEAAKFVKGIAANGGAILFVGTKRQARGVVADAIEKIKNSTADGHTYVVLERWVGGTLTNFDQVGKNYKKLKDLQAKLVSPTERAKYTKKEVGMWDKERVKLERFYGGIFTIGKLPEIIFIVDTHKEHQAVSEAIRTGVPVVGIVDTNADPSVVDYTIPANDDAVGSVKLIVDYIADAWIEGLKVLEGKAEKEEKAKKAEENKAENKEKESTEEKPAKKAKTAKPKTPKAEKPKE